MLEFKNLQNYNEKFIPYRGRKISEKLIHYKVHKVIADELLALIPSRFFTLHWILSDPETLQQTLSRPLDTLFRLERNGVSVPDISFNIVGISVMVRYEFRNPEREYSWMTERESHEVFSINPNIRIETDGSVTASIYTRIYTINVNEEYHDEVVINFESDDTPFEDALTPFVKGKEEIIQNALKDIEDNY